MAGWFGVLLVIATGALSGGTLANSLRAGKCAIGWGGVGLVSSRTMQLHGGPHAARVSSSPARRRPSWPKLWSHWTVTGKASGGSAREPPVRRQAGRAPHASGVRSLACLRWYG